jgi:hypothetical protein
VLSQPAAAREGARSCFILRIEVSVYEEINKILRTLHGPRTPLFRPPRTPRTPMFSSGRAVRAAATDGRQVWTGDGAGRR